MAIDKQTNKQLRKALKTNSKKPSWWTRYKRKKLLAKLVEELKKENIEAVWVHNDLVTGVDKKPVSIVAYCLFAKQSKEGLANEIDGKMDAKIPKYKVNIIDVNTLLPSIKASIFKEVTQIL